MNVWSETEFDEREQDDGRHIDERRAQLTGEAASQRVDAPREAHPLKQDEERALHSEPHDSPTYYELAPVKAPPWKWYIPAYFYVGGVTGAAGALGAVTQWRPELTALTRQARGLAAAGHVVSAGLLIADLGRPERFMHMLRVFRPTSPMNLGSWLLTAGGAFSTAAWLLGDREPGPLQGVGRAAGLLGGLSGVALSTYTAVLLANTAVPLWSRTRRSLPWLFGASAASSAAALLSLGATEPAAARVLQRFGAVGKAGELVAAEVMEREADHPRVRASLHEGRSGRLWRAAKLLTGASLLLDLLPKRSRPTGVVSSLLGTAGAVAGRFAVTEAGKATASDPRATFEPQRLDPPSAPPELPLFEDEPEVAAAFDAAHRDAPALEPRTPQPTAAAEAGAGAARASGSLEESPR